MSAIDDAHALVVGIAAYHQVPALPTVDDAPAIATALDYQSSNVRLLLDGDATRQTMSAELSALATRATADSTVFVYFSGHGGRIAAGEAAGEYLLPVDAVYPDDEALARTAISGAEVSAALKAIAARRVVVVFDCCHAGGIGQPRDVGAEPVVPGLSDGFYEELKRGRGRVIIASSRSDELSWVPAGAQFGLFTEHLVAGLRGDAAGPDGLVRVFDLFEYVQPRVTAHQRNQHPVFKAEVEENFAVARAATPLVRPPEPAPVEGETYRYDAYVSYVDREPDSSWVWGTLLPRLESAGLRVAVSNDVAEPGVARVVNVERGIRQAKRTIVVLSDAYLGDHAAEFEHVLAQTMGIDEGTYRIVPMTFAPLDRRRVPARLAMLTTLDLSRPDRADRGFDRLVRALRGPLPRTG